jgi:hypothetical protein
LKSRLRRDGLCDEICAKLEIKRKKPGHDQLSKSELTSILNFLRTVKQDRYDIRVVLGEFDEGDSGAKYNLRDIVNRW